MIAPEDGTGTQVNDGLGKVWKSGAPIRHRRPRYFCETGYLVNSEQLFFCHASTLCYLRWSVNYVHTIESNVHKVKSKMVGGASVLGR